MPEFPSEHVERYTANREIRRRGGELWKRIQAMDAGPLDSEYWQSHMLDWLTEDAEFKVDMFRFVDALPSLHTTEQIARHIREYLLKPHRQLPKIFDLILHASASGISAPLAAHVVRSQVTTMAHRFIVGESASNAIPNLRALYDEGYGFTADILGEDVFSAMESERYAARYLTLIDELAVATSRWPESLVIQHNHLGPIPRANVSLKVSAMAPFLRAVDTEGVVGRLKERILPILLTARRLGVFVNFDMEQWARHGITRQVFAELAMHPQLQDWPHLGIAVQAYLRESDDDISFLLDLARRRQTPLVVRLVRGAYWDYEVVQARLHGWRCPVFEEKWQTDANYERLSRRLLDNINWLQPAFASHNLRSLMHAIVYAERQGIPRQAIEFQMLHGMAAPERQVLRDEGYRVRVYAPIGQMLPGMAYLVRRLLENSSNVGFLRLSFHEHRDIDQLLRPPQAPRHEGSEPRPTPQAFHNTSLADFTCSSERSRFAEALVRLSESLPIQVPVVLNGEHALTPIRNQRCCPSDLSLVIANVAMASASHADEAVKCAHLAWPAWQQRPVDARVQHLLRLADRLETDRWRLAALISMEVGKPWVEADADVAEAIDFCRYYAGQAQRDLSPRQSTIPGEANEYLFQGHGVTAVIAPWNFPLAILCGMSVAALVSGNPVIMKPAEQASATAFALYQHMIAADFPDPVVQFLPGDGPSIGGRLVNHPDVGVIAFTGSKEVGLAIMTAANQVQPGQQQLKRVICEMGGKNAIVVDDDADLDQALHGVLESAFGFAGQKCSAGSRLILLEDIAVPFLERLCAALRNVHVGPAHHSACMLGPVIDADAHRRLLHLIAHPPSGARQLYRGHVPDNGYYVPPTVFEVDSSDHELMREELFGPILTALVVPDMASALAAAQLGSYALTAGIYSRSPAHITQARLAFRAGNIYVNRPTTGALVARQPFGGYGLSGTGIKAGGPGYLRQFCDEVCVTENLIRCGFAPTTDD